MSKEEQYRGMELMVASEDGEKVYQRVELDEWGHSDNPLDVRISTDTEKCDACGAEIPINEAFIAVADWTRICGKCVGVIAPLYVGRVKANWDLVARGGESRKVTLPAGAPTSASMP